MGLAYSCALSLARYAELIQYDDCAFWGVSTGDQVNDPCRMFWTEFERQEVANALLQAQIMLEDFIRYPLCRQWITGDYEGDGRLVDSQQWRNNPLITRWGMVIQGGVQVQTVLQAGATVSYASEPATVTLSGVTIGSTDEVAVFYPGRDRRVTPSEMSYSGGTLTIRIPRCRLVKEDLLDEVTHDIGLDYNDVTNFVTTVDVERHYNDPSTQAVFVKDTDCGSSNLCAETTQTGCIRIKDARLGIIQVAPGTYTDGAWRSSLVCGGFDTIRLNYQAGLKSINRDIENIILRLAHTLMAEEACGCDVAKRLWHRDNYTPQILTAERLNCPFGAAMGAWFAYQWAKGNKLTRAMPYG